MSNTIRRSRGDAGFSLAEMLVSTAIAAFGLAGIAALIGTGVQLQTNARAGTISVNLAVAELERLRALPLTSAERALGGSLTADVANHFIVRQSGQGAGDAQMRLRWVVADGPACGNVTWAGPTSPLECSKAVTVVAIPQNVMARTVRVTGILWR